jgi:predicted O-methyltransferase YrrM
MSHRETIKLLLGEAPYFSGATCGVQIPVKEALFLTALVSVCSGEKPIKVAEIGSWTGFSALTWAHAIDRFHPAGGEVLCIDQWLPYFSEVDKDQEGYREMNELAATGVAFDLFQHNISCGPSRIPIRYSRGNSAEVLKTFDESTFDLVYIDGTHYYEGVKADLLAAKRIVADGGLLAGDDLELKIGSQLSADEARAHLDRDYVQSASGNPYHPGVSLAVHEVVGPVSSFGRKWFVRRTGSSFAPCALANARMIIAPHWPDEMKAEARASLRPGKAADSAANA